MQVSGSTTTTAVGILFRLWLKTDRLLATVDFGVDTIDSLQCSQGSVNGIDQGFANDDLSFAANLWRGEFNLGEFTVGGTSFETGWTTCGATNSLTPDSGESDLITTAQSLTVTGHFAPQTSLSVTVAGNSYVWGVDSELSTSGTDWTLDLTALVLNEASYPITVDVDGQAAVDMRTIVIDKTGPAVTIDSITEDTGNAQTDFVSTDDRLVFSGTHEIGSELVVEIGGLVFDFEDPLLSTDGVGNWTLDLTTIPLPAGNSQIEVTASDAATNTTVVTQNVEIIAVSIDELSDDTGALGDFVTLDRTIVLSGRFAPGTDLSIDFEGTIYTLSSAELTAVGDEWTLDLTGTTLDLNDYLVTAYTSDLLGNTATDSRLLSISDSCNIVSFYELIDGNHNPISSLAQVLVDPQGTPTVNIDLEARKAVAAQTYYVDELRHLR